MRSRLSRFLCALLMALGCLTAWPLPARAGIAVTPMIVMIENRNRYADITIVNTNPDISSYDMGWTFYRMMEEGSRYVKSDVSTTEFDLSKHLVFTPRRVTLGPNSAQKIRIALRLNGEAPPPGDYRTHFFVRELPKTQSQEDTADKRQATLGVNINFGFSVPVIYRVGENTDTASIGTVTVKRNAETGVINVNVPVTKSKSGYSILGKVVVYHVDGKTEKIIGSISNANIFPEITKRTYEVGLKVKSLESGTLKVVYRDRDDDRLVYDEKIIPIQ